MSNNLDADSELKKTLPTISVKIIAAASITLTLFFYAGTYVFSIFGETLLKSLGAQTAEVFMREGQRLERSGQLLGAIQSYRKSLSLGIANSASRDDTIRRLSISLAEQGRSPEFRYNPYASVIDGEFDSEAELFRWLDGGEIQNALLDSIEKCSGRSSLRLAASNGASKLSIKRSARVIPDEEYEFSFWSRSDGSQTAVLKVATSPTENQTAFQREFDLSSVHDWTQKVIVFRVPTSTHEVSVVLDARSSASQKLDFWLDGISLRRADASLLTNGSFEYGGEGHSFWTGKPGANVNVRSNTEHVKEGRSSLEVFLPGATDFGFYQTIDVLPGNTYIVEGYIRTENIGGLGACIEVQDAERGWKAFSAWTTPRILGTNEWQHVSLEFKVPNETASVAVLLRRPSDDNSTRESGSIWFDACEMHPLVKQND